MSDSIYEFGFLSSTLTGGSKGDAWFGYVTANTGTYTVGSSFYADRSQGFGHDGFYIILKEYAFGYDLAATRGWGFEDGVVRVTSYYDSLTGAYYQPWARVNGRVDATELPFGTNYLGSEFGYSFSNSKVFDFGLGNFSALGI